VSEMIDRVAKAIEAAAYDGLEPGLAKELAVAVIAAMREPTKAMPAADLWRRMIDEALK
jgi:hypothetical protein